MKRDWRNSKDYEFTKELGPELWAWQFLRRNPAYRKDYDWFISIWRALEVDYGVAPERNFSRWKLDPRAYAPEEMTQGFCDDDKSCASPDGDKVMIECAMGAKWGFYKFPNSPDTEFPVIPDKLIWREPDIGVSTPSGDAQIYDMDLRFDVRLSLNEQLASAKRRLVSQQRKLYQEGNGFNVKSLTNYLRLLDADNSKDQVIADNLHGGDLNELATCRLQAQYTCLSDYRLLPVSRLG